MNLSQDAIMLKICKFCHNSFIPKNLYDILQHKNKANVYSFRKKLSNNDGIIYF